MLKSRSKKTFHQLCLYKIVKTSLHSKLFRLRRWNIYNQWSCQLRLGCYRQLKRIYKTKQRICRNIDAYKFRMKKKYERQIICNFCQLPRLTTNHIPLPARYSCLASKKLLVRQISNFCHLHSGWTNDKYLWICIWQIF